MPQPLLLTSFQTWQAHQTTNSSDDLLGIIRDRLAFAQHHYLRHLPVNTAIASQMVCEQIDQLRPVGVICCGMAETRSRLSLERWAREPEGDRSFTTTLSLTPLLAQLSHTTLSEDAGQFVCEGLYFHVLHHLATCPWPAWGLFVHVPVLTPENQATIVADFTQLLHLLQKCKAQASAALRANCNLPEP